MQLSQKAICLRTIDYSETSQVVCFLTRQQGVVRLLAKGTKRPRSRSGGAIDLFSEGELVYISSARQSLGTLVEFRESTTRPALRKSKTSIQAALYMLELTASMLAEADPHPEVFDLLHNAMDRLADPKPPQPAVLAYFQYRLLKHVGLMGELKRCAACGGDLNKAEGRDIWFSSRVGGLVCRPCSADQAEKIAVDGPTRAGLAAMLAAEVGKKVSLPGPQAIGVNRLLAYHIAQQLGRPMRMARHVLA